MIFTIAISATRVLPALALSLLLAACGGSESLLSDTTRADAAPASNGGTPLTSSTGGISTNNAWFVTSGILRAIDTVGGLSDLGDQAVVAGVVAATGAAAPLSVAGVAAALLDEVRDIAARHGVAPRRLSGVLVDPLIPCGADGSAAYTAGNPSVISFQKCALGIGTVTGAMEISEPGADGAWDVVAGLRFRPGQSTFTIALDNHTLEINGGITFRRRTDGALTTLQIEFTDAAGLAITSKVARLDGGMDERTDTLQGFLLETTTDISASARTVAYNGEVTSETMGDEVVYVTTPAGAPLRFGIGTAMHYSGHMRLAVVNGSYVDVTLVPNTKDVALEIDEDGDGPLTKTDPFITPWEQLIAGVPP